MNCRAGLGRATPRLFWALVFCLSACHDDVNEDTWRDLGTVPAPVSTQLNHTPLIVAGDRVLVGTSDGIWARPLDGPADWQQVVLPLRIKGGTGSPVNPIAVF